MLRYVLHQVRLYGDVLNRIKFLYTKYEKQDVEFLSRYIEFALLNIKKIFSGSLAYVQLLRDRPELFDVEGDSALASERERELAAHLAERELFLFPARGFSPFLGKLTMTTRCNYECAHCFQKGYRTQDLVSLSDVEAYLDRLDEAGIRTFSITGGEPFLFPELLFDIISLAHDRGTKVYGVTTNGFWCKERKKVMEYLERLKELNYGGNINISIGRGHEQYLEPLTQFRELKQLSKKVLGRNIFYFNLEEVSYERFLETRTVLRKEIGNYYFKPMLITQIGGGHSFKKEIEEELPSTCSMGRCEGLGLHMLPDGRISFCVGTASFLDEFIIGTVDGQLTVQEMMAKQESLITLLANQKGEAIYDALLSSERIKSRGQFPVLCDLCIYLAQNEDILGELHAHMTEGRDS